MPSGKTNKSLRVVILVLPHRSVQIRIFSFIESFGESTIRPPMFILPTSIQRNFTSLQNTCRAASQARQVRPFTLYRPCTALTHVRITATKVKTPLLRKGKLSIKSAPRYLIHYYHYSHCRTSLWSIALTKQNQSRDANLGETLEKSNPSHRVFVLTR